MPPTLRSRESRGILQTSRIAKSRNASPRVQKASSSPSLALSGQEDSSSVSKTRKSASTSPTPSIGSLDPAGPKFIPFPCQWKGCEAELHNLDTLRRHLFKVHGSQVLPHKSITCLWADCIAGSTPPRASCGEISIPSSSAPSFKTPLEFQSHVEKTHLVPIAWKMGDGPRESCLDDTVDALSFLKDSFGRQVTPSVENQKIEKGNAYRNNSRRWAAVFEAERRSKITLKPMVKVVKSKS